MLKPKLDANGEPEKDASGQPVMVDDGQGDGVTPSLADLQKQIADMKAGWDADRSRADELAGTNSRLTQLLEAAAKQKDRPLTATEKRKLTKDYAGVYNIPNEAVEDILAEAEQRSYERVKGEWEQEKALNAMRDQFYMDNPELKQHAPIVQAIANDIRGQHPDWTMGKALEETSKQAKQYLQKMRTAPGAGGGAPPEPPPVIPGGGAPPVPGNAGGGGEPILTPEKELERELKERRERQTKALGGAR